MLAAFVADLRSTPIVTTQNVAVIKNYIAEKYPGLSFEKATLMLADAVRQIVDQKIRAISEQYRAAIRENLFRNLKRRTTFRIDAADILEASLPLHWAGEELAAEICHWIHQTIKKMVPLETLHVIYHQLTERYAKDDILKLEVLAARLDQADMLKERAAAGREERMKRRLITQIRLERKTQQPEGEDDAGNEPLATDREIPTPDPAVLKQVPAPAEKRSGYLSRRIAVLTTTAGMVILAMFLINLIRESVRETAVLASSDIHHSVKYAESRSSTEPGIGLGTNYGKDTGSNVRQTVMAEEADTGDSGLNYVETKPLNGRDNLEFWADATAYDLSMESCGKTPEHPLYGITRSGAKASAGRTIAVDPEIIPLGSKVYITFPENYGYLDGIYVAEDTGRLIKGRRIDLFFGEDRPGERNVYQDAMKFGVQKVKLEIMGTE